MNRPLLSVQYPFRMGNTEEIHVTLLDAAVHASPHHVLRFDFYPFIAPNHPGRHMAYFDVPLEWVAGAALWVTVRRDTLSVRDGKTAREFVPVWKGTVPLSGYTRVTISLECVEGTTRRRLDASVSPALVIVTGHPIPLEWVQFPITQYCNLTCPMCPRQSGLPYNQQHAPADVLAAVLEAAPKLTYVGLQGIGEPLLHPDLPRIVKSFRDRLPDHGRIALTTNGTLLTRDLAARLFDAGLNTVTFSIDGATRSVYEARRTGAHFERLRENVTTATTLARNTGRKDLWLGTNMVVAPDNMAEVPEFVRLVARLGLSAASFFRGRDYPSMRITDLNPDLWSQLQEEATILGKQLGVATHFAKPRSGPLPECPFMCSVYLWLTGEVAPCHGMEPPGAPWPTQLFGNVRERPLLELWEALEFRAFRDGVLSGELPEECRDCTFPDSVSTGG